MLVADDPAAFSKPFDVGSIWDIAGNPHQGDQHNTERKWKTQKIVCVFCPFRPCREIIGPDQWKQERPSERNVEPAKSQDDEADRGHPVHEALEPIEAHDLTPGKTALKLHRSAHEIEDHKHREKAEDRDGGNPAQRYIMEILPIAS